jgi:hypothetical protein
MHVKWQPPEMISGRLTRYELLCNRRCIYAGIEQEYRATMLKSDTEYSMEIIAVTNEGRFRSRPARARTLKDECITHLSIYLSIYLYIYNDDSFMCSLVFLSIVIRQCFSTSFTL